MQTQVPLALITPTLDGYVLGVLARADAKMTVGTIQSALRNRSYGGIRKVLDRLVDQGIVSFEKVGNIGSYSLNREHMAASLIIQLIRLPQELLSRIGRELEQWDPVPSYAAVFGSAINGTMRVDSDIDLFVVSAGRIDPQGWETHRHALALKVTAWTGNDCRILHMTEEEVWNGATTERVLADIASTPHGTVVGQQGWLAAVLRDARRGARADEAL